MNPVKLSKNKLEELWRKSREKRVRTCVVLPQGQQEKDRKEIQREKEYPSRGKGEFVHLLHALRSQLEDLSHHIRFLCPSLLTWRLLELVCQDHGKSH